MNGQEEQNKNNLAEARANGLSNPNTSASTDSGNPKERLEAARNLSANKTQNASSNASDTKKRAKQMLQALSAMSLGNYVDPFMDWIFGIALCFAILKDVVDLVGLGSLPVIGTVITFFASAIIFFSLLLAGGGGKKKKWAKKYGIIIVGTLLEFLFGLNFLPVETCVVIAVYGLTLIERKEAAEEQEQQAEGKPRESFA